MNIETKNLIAVGRVRRPKGLNGEVRMELYNPESELLSTARKVAIGDNPANVAWVSLQNVSRCANSYIVRLEGIETQERAKVFSGKKVFVDRSDFPTLSKGEHYYCDLLGCKVETMTGQMLGTLKEVMYGASNDIYVICNNQVETLLAAIPGIILKVDLDQHKITVNFPEVVDAF